MGTPSHLLDKPKGSRFLLYSKLKTASFTCEADPRASFCLYIPMTHPVSRLHAGESLDPHQPAYPLVVLIHHTYLNGESMRNFFSDWAENNQCVLLSVLFPFSFRPVSSLDYDTGVFSRRCLWQNGEFADYYKYMRDPSPTDPVRYDLLILDMIRTVDREWGSIETERFCIAGYSAGGQAALRFFYLHPDKIKAAAIGAPGGFTSIDPSMAWPEGTADVQDMFGVEVTHERLAHSGAQARVQLCIGQLDTGRKDGGTHSRPQILDAIAKDLKAAGLVHEMVTVPGIGHEGFEEAYAVQMEFLEKYLRK